ncbi:hypothetical protein AKJ57_01290 [candidate division MSBL1 archaeon SCGC-AAA259A05]|uniref:DUF2283 domain-containing protein n=1 Tax=candidate division MSBL1 archaeon SCGC-AAA259A05 TaxID=1698259 RepID=A0A133UB53_9EURY|nr:hypothetical protein AKJ57_01290 [candidate division MSBL1 archaeon SCGC-AAA259A05]
MRITYDSEANALNIRFQEGEYEKSREVSEGIIIDYSKNEEIMSIEILDADEKISPKTIESITTPSAAKSTA